MTTIRSFTVSVYALRRMPTGAEVLLLERAKAPAEGAWFQVTGRLNPGEGAAAAAWREVEEETGVVPDHLYTRPTGSSNGTGRRATPYSSRPYSSRSCLLRLQFGSTSRIADIGGSRLPRPSTSFHFPFSAIAWSACGATLSSGSLRRVWRSCGNDHRSRVSWYGF
ncbi:MAG: NUDIX domain-containing protein [Alphaproteobacteria bacterium]|nr:NUDIX domain-containing protein [Alphaproteobacteria bacterium]